ncbi:MAG: DUF3418 domain-containing protein, partial [Dermatophilaceae bacterium]
DRLNQVTSTGFDWHVPGFREDLVTALIRALPKGIRRSFVPAPDHARAVLGDLDPSAGPLVESLAAALQRRAGVPVRPGDFELERIPPHLRLTFAVDGPDGAVLASGKDLEAVRDAATPDLRRQVRAASSSLERTGMTSWELDTVQETFASDSGVIGYPALVDTGAAVDLRVLPTRGEAQAQHRLGVRRLLLLGITPPWKQILARLSNTQKLALGTNPHGSVPNLLADCLAAAVDAISAEVVTGARSGQPSVNQPGVSQASSAEPGGQTGHRVRSREDVESALAAVRTHTTSRVVQIVGDVVPILAAHVRIAAAVTALESSSNPAVRPMLADVQAQWSALVRPGFIADTGAARLVDLHRYLRAIEHRLDKAPSNLARDAQALEQVDLVEGRYADLLESLRPSQRGAADVVAIGWMIEELRVSLFAQTLGTAHSVSPQRIVKAIAKITP